MKRSDLNDQTIVRSKTELRFGFGPGERDRAGVETDEPRFPSIGRRRPTAIERRRNITKKETLGYWAQPEVIACKPVRP